MDYWPHVLCHANKRFGANRHAAWICSDVAAMTRNGLKLLLWLAAMLASGVATAGAQVSIGPQGAEEGVIRRQSWLIPAQDRSTLMWTSVFRPPGDGPFPLAIINHGTTQNELQRLAEDLPEYGRLTQWLVERGSWIAPFYVTAGVLTVGSLIWIFLIDPEKSVVEPVGGKLRS